APLLRRATSSWALTCRATPVEMPAARRSSQMRVMAIRQPPAGARERIERARRAHRRLISPRAQPIVHARPLREEARREHRSCVVRGQGESRIMKSNTLRRALCTLLGCTALVPVAARAQETIVPRNAAEARALENTVRAQASDFALESTRP